MAYANTFVNLIHLPLFSDMQDIYTDIGNRLSGNPTERAAKKMATMPEASDIPDEVIKELITNEARSILPSQLFGFRFSNSIWDKFKTWELDVCLPRKGLILNQGERASVMSDNSQVPVRYSSRAGVADARIQNSSNAHACINARGAGGRFSVYGCGYNTLAFLNIITVPECQDAVKTLVANNNNNGVGLLTAEIIQIIHQKAAAASVPLPHTARKYMKFDVNKINSITQTDPSILKTLKCLNVLTILTLIYKSLFVNNGGDNDCILVKQILNETTGLGHTVIYALDNNGRLISCDPQLGKWHRLITDVSIMKLANGTYDGISVLVITPTAPASVQPTTIPGYVPASYLPPASAFQQGPAAQQDFQQRWPQGGRGSKENKKKEAHKSRRKKTKKKGGAKSKKKKNKKSRKKSSKKKATSGINNIPVGTETHKLHIIKDIEDFTEEEVNEYYKEISKGLKKLKKMF